MVPALVALALAASSGPGRAIGLTPPPAARPAVDWTRVREETLRYEGALARERALRARTDFAAEAAALLEDAARRAGPAPSIWERFGVPSAPTAEQRQSLHQAAVDVDAAAGLLGLAARRAQDRLGVVEQALASRPGQEAALARLREERELLAQRAALVGALAPRIGAGLEARAGGAWERLGYAFQQLFRCDAETRLERLMGEMRAWGDLREPEVLGAELTYVQGALGPAQLPQGQVSPAYQAAGAVALEDSTAGREVELSEPVTAKALELGTAVAAADFVKNQLALDWYAGSLKGSTETLREGRGNDVDLATLLIALLRAQGTPARYVQGTIELSLERVADLMGLLTAADQGAPLDAARRALVLNALSAAGIASEQVIAGGRVSAVRLQHTWVEAYVPFADYHGTGASRAGKLWVPIEPAFTGGAKYVATPPAADALAAAGGSAAAVTDAYLASPPGASPLELYRQRVRAGLPAGTTYEQTLRRVEQRPERQLMLSNDFVYEVRSVQGEYAFLPDAAKHRLHLVARDASGVLLEATLPLHQVAGHRTLLSFKPATDLDAQLIDEAGGVYQAPASAVQVDLVLRVDGQERAAATRSLGLGQRYDWTVELLLPDGSKKAVRNRGVAGNLTAIGLGGPKNAYAEPAQAGGDLDGDAARFVYERAAAYANAWTDAEEELARSLGVVPVRPTANVVFVQNQLAVDVVAGVPDRVAWKGLEVDADLRTLVPLELQPGRGKDLLRLSGYQGSYLEAQALTDGTGERAVSAVTVLQTAAARGLPMLTVTAANAQAVLPTLSASADVLADVRDQVARCREVRIPASPLGIEAWVGTGFVARDPATEEGGYFLSGVVSGGQTVTSPGSWSDPELVRTLESPGSPSPVTDLTQVARIVMAAGDMRSVQVGTVSPLALKVAVVTDRGLPVAGATVVFSRSTAYASQPGLAKTKSELETALAEPSATTAAAAVHALSSEVRVLTDRKGEAWVYATPDPLIERQFILSSAQPAPQELGFNAIAARVEAPGRTLALAQPFALIGLPGPAERVELGAQVRFQATQALLLPTVWPATVRDHFGNPLANQAVTWAQLDLNGLPLPDAQAGRLVDAPSVTARESVLDPADPLQKVALTQGTPTNGQVVAEFIAPATAGSVVVRVKAGAATSDYRVDAVETSESFKLVPAGSARQDFDGIVGDRFPVPVGFQLLRKVTSAGGTTWTPIRGDEPDLSVATVQMDVLGSDGRLLDRQAVSPKDTLAQGPGIDAIDPATVATFWPRYAVSGGSAPTQEPIPAVLGLGSGQAPWNEYHLFSATVLDAEGHFKCCSDRFFFGLYSGTIDVQPVGANDGSGQPVPVVVAGTGQAGFRVVNPASYDVASTLTQVPVAGSAPPLVVPSADALPRLPGSPDAFRTYAHATTQFLFPVDPNSRGGDATLVVSNKDPALAGQKQELARKTLTVGAGALAVPGSLSASGLQAAWVLPVRNFESSAAGPDGTYLAPDPTEFPIARPASLDFAAVASGKLTVRSGGAAIAQAKVTLDEQGVPAVSPIDATLPVPEVLSSGLLRMSVGPGDPQGQSVEIELLPDGQSAAQVQVVPLRTAIEDVGVAPVGHTFVKDVSVADGHLTKQFEDLRVPGRNGGLELTRTYTSRGSGVSPLGSGWTHSYRAHVLHDTSRGLDRYLLIGGEGSGQAFDCTSAPCRPQRGFHGKLSIETVATGGGAPRTEVVFTAKSGHVYRFGQRVVREGEEYLLTSISDPLGIETRVEPAGPEANYEVLRVTEPGGRALLFSYDPPALFGGHATLHQVQLLGPGDADLGVCVQYAYDKNGNLSGATRYDGACGAGRPVRTEAFHYLDSPVAQLQDNLETYTDPNGNVTRYAYYQDSDALPGEAGFVFFGDKRERVKTVTEPAPTGGVTTFTYGLDLGPLAPGTQALTGRAQGYTTQVQGPRPGVPPTLYRMNAYGAGEEVVRPVSPGVFATSSAAWDRQHQRKTAELDARGRRTAYRYDDRGNLVERRVATTALPPSGDDTLGAAGLRDAAGAAVDETVELWAYDPDYAAMTCHVDPEGRVTVQTVDHGLVLASTRRATPVARRLLVAGADCAALANTVQSDPDRDLTVHHFYCGINATCPAGFRPGDLEHSEDANGNKTEVLAYDAYGNPTQTRVHPSASQDITTTSVFDDRSRLGEQSDTAGHRSRREYDALDRVVRLTRFNDGHADAPAQVRAYAYYPGGQARDEQVLDGTAPDAAVLYTRHTELDSLNLPHQVTESGVGLSQPLLSVTEHDEAGNAVRLTDRRGVVTHVAYDFADRPTARYLDLAANAGQHLTADDVGVTGDFPHQVSAYRYDLVGNKVAESDLHGFVTRFELDGLYRVVKTHLPTVPGPELTGTADYVLQHGYDLVGNKVLEVDGNGHGTRMAYDFANRITSTEDDLGRREEREYDANGNLVLLRQRQGAGGPIHLERTTAHFDGLNRPIDVSETVQSPTGPLSYAQAFAYDDRAASRAVASRDRRGLVTVQYPDALDLTERVVVDSGSAPLARSPDVGAAAGPALELTSRFEYDAFGNLSASTDPLGRRTAERRDALQRVVERDLPMGVVEHVTYDGEGHPIHRVDRRGIESDSFFDALGRPVREELTESISNAGATLVTSRHAYADAPAGGLVQVTEYDARSNPTRHQLDALGREVTTTDALGEVSQARYDARNKRLVVDRKGYQTRFTYDAVDRLTDQDDFDLGATQPTYHQGTTYADDALTLTSTDRGGIQTFTESDGLGRAVRSTRSKGTDTQQTVTTYDGDGNATDVEDANHHHTRSVFDGANRRLSEDRGYGTPEHELTRYAYDAAGNLLTVQRQRIAVPDLTQNYDDLNRVVRSVDALGHATTRAFDEAGNKLCELRPLGGDPLSPGSLAGRSVASLRDAVCNATSYLTRFEYEELGQLTRVTDALGGESTFLYDEARNLLSKQDANASLSTYDYDALNRRSAEHQHLDAHPRLTSRQSVPAGSENAAGAPDPVAGVGTLDYRTTYDANGNPDLNTDPKGQLVQSSFGLLNRLADQSFTPASGAPRVYPATTGIAYTYWPNGVLQSVTEHKALSPSLRLDEVTSRTYDGLDRLKTEVRTYGGSSGASKALSYAYDAKGNRTLVTDSDGVSTRYTFDALDRIRTATLDGAAQPATYVYYPDGLLQTETQPNGILETRTYDDAGRLADLVSKRGSTTVSHYVYAYDANGNRQSLSETRTRPATQALFTESTQYEYDGLDRLTRATYPDKESRYGLDAVGNRLQETEVDLTSGATTHEVIATFNRADWLLSRSDARDASASTSFGYDLNGNLTGKLSASLSREIAWDVRDTVSTVTDNGSLAGQYDYNWQKQRTKRDTANEHVEYVLDDKFVLQEARSDQGHASYRRYHYAMSQMAVADNGTLSFISTDAQGSTSDITSTSGSVTKAEQYDAWGKSRNGTAPTASEPKLGYTGHQFDPETGLIYARARYYDSELGVFLSRDPINRGPLDAPRLHLYIYGRGNPLMFTDPTGEWEWWTKKDWQNAGKALAGYTVGAAKVLAAPGLATYYITNAGLYAATGESQYAAGAEKFNEGLAGLLSIQDSQQAAKAVLDSAVATAKGIGDAIDRGDAYAAGEGTGTLATQTVLMADSMSGVKVNISGGPSMAPAMALAGGGARRFSNGLSIAVSGGPKFPEAILAVAGGSGNDDDKTTPQESPSGPGTTPGPGQPTPTPQQPTPPVGPSSPALPQPAAIPPAAPASSGPVTSPTVTGTSQPARQLISRIKESTKLVKEAEWAGKSVQTSIDRLTLQLSRGNLNPGIGTKPIGQGISEARAADGARVYFQETDTGAIEILGKSNKANQPQVIKEVLKKFGSQE